MDNKDKIRQKIKKLPNTSVLTFVAKQLGMKPTEFIIKNIFSMISNSVNNGALKVADISKSIGNLGKKNKEDDTGIDWDNVTIDDSTVKYKFLFSKDILKSLAEHAEQLGDILKDAESEAENIDNNLKKRLGKRGVKVSDEELKNDTALIVNTVEGKGQEKKSGKELASEIKQKKEKIKKIVQKKIEADKVRRKKMKSTSSSSSKAQNVDQGDIQSLQNTIKTDILGKISGSYKRKFQFGIYETNQFKQQLKTSLNKTLNKIDQPNIIAASISFKPQDAQKVVSEKEGKPGYKVRILRRNDDDKFLNKIKDTIRKSIISNVEKGKLGKVSYSYYKYWNGEGSEKHLNTIFVFFGYNAETDQTSDEVIQEDMSADDYTMKTIGIGYGLTRGPAFLLRKYLTEKERWALNSVMTNSYMEYMGAKQEVTIDGAKITYTYVGELVKQLGEDHPYIKRLMYEDAQGRLAGLKILKKALSDDKFRISIGSQNFKQLKMGLFGIDPQSDDINFINDQLKFQTDVVNEFRTDLQLSPSTETAKEIVKDTGSKPEDTFGPPQNANSPDGSENVAQTGNSGQDIPEETKQKSPFFKGFKKGTLLGWLRVGAKVTGYVLNHGKSLVDKIGAVKIAHEEDSDLYAEAKFLISNENSDKDYSDSQFSVRYSLSDNKWHATNIDDRKMKIDEEKLIEAFKKTQSWKEFHDICVKRLEAICGNPNSELLISQLQNVKNSKMNSDIIDDMTKVIQNHDKIKETL